MRIIKFLLSLLMLVSTSNALAQPTANIVPVPHPKWFVLGVVNVYVSTTGSDTACDGTTSASAGAGVTACAYASVGKAILSVPSGFVAAPWIHVAAGTYTADDQWVMAASPARTSTPAPAGGIIRVVDDCSSPTATFTTTGVGTAVVSSAGGGQTGGVTKIAQFTFAPTVGTGSITGVTDGSHYLTNTPASGTAPSLNLVRASSSPNLVLGATATTALTTRRLCPYSVIFSGSINVLGAPNSGVTVGTNQGLTIIGLKFSLLSGKAFLCNACNVTGSSNTLNLSEVSFQQSTINSKAGLVTTMSGRLGLSNNLFLAGAYLGGQWGSVSGNILKNTSAQLLWVNCGDTSSLTTITAQGGISGLTRNDFEGTGTGIMACASWVAQPVTGTNSVDITGAFLDLHYGARYIVFGTGSGVTGKVTVASTVKTGSIAITNGAYSVVNQTVTGQDWLVGAQTVVATASLPVMDYGSGAMALPAEAGPTALPVLQGGTGSATAPTLGTATTDLLTVNGRITQVAGTPSSYTSGTCSSESGTGDDEHGSVTATCTAGQTIIVTYSTTYASSTHCVISPTNAIAAVATLGTAYGVGSTTALTITVPNTSASPATWEYRCGK